jgi:DNA-binding NarL/FixJ family response regulator
VVPTPVKALRVLVIDDNPILCAGLERWLSREPLILWVACQTDWRKAEAEAHNRQPDIVLLDIDLPGTSGLDLIAPLLATCSTCKVVMLSGLVTREMVERALDLGAAGYLVKDQDARTIAQLIRQAAEGTVVLCPTTEAALAGA